MDNQNAIRLLRHRRSAFFFGDAGPSLPAGTRARWRLTPGDPRGWHANVVGFVEGPVERLPRVLDIACAWFDDHRTDTWVDADDRGVLFQHQHLITDRGFRLIDNLEAMICRRSPAVPVRPDLAIRPATDAAGLEVAAWIAVQNDVAFPVPRDSIAVQRRLRRYRREYADWNYRFVVAYLDGEPVGTARLTDEELPVIVGVATLARARRRGVATAVTSALAARAVSERGASALYVERDSEAQGIYRKIGFEPLYRSRTWHRAYGQAGWSGQPGI